MLGEGPPAAGMEGDLFADPVEAPEHFLERVAADVEDAIAVAAEPFQLAPQVDAALRIDHHVHVGIAGLQRCDLTPRRPARQTLAAQVAEHEARGVLLQPGAMANDRLLAALEIEQRLEQAVAVDSLE